MDKPPAGTGPFGGAPGWPGLLVMMLSVGSIAVVPFGQPWWSLIAYGVVLVAGAVLIGIQRRLVMAPGVGTRDLRSITLSPGEKVAIAFLVVGTMANAWVFAQEIARRVWAG